MINIQHFQFNVRFLYNAIRETKNKYNFTSEDILGYLYESPLFIEERKDIIRKGIEAYISNDFIVAAHILITTN